eukprot:UC1_evm1s1236
MQQQQTYGELLSLTGSRRTLQKGSRVGQTKKRARKSPSAKSASTTTAQMITGSARSTTRATNDITTIMKLDDEANVSSEDELTVAMTDEEDIGVTTANITNTTPSSNSSASSSSFDQEIIFSGTASDELEVLDPADEKRLRKLLAEKQRAL